VAFAKSLHDPLTVHHRHNEKEYQNGNNR